MIRRYRSMEAFDIAEILRAEAFGAIRRLRRVLRDSDEDLSALEAAPSGLEHLEIDLSRVLHFQGLRVPRSTPRVALGASLETLALSGPMGSTQGTDFFLGLLRSQLESPPRRIDLARVRVEEGRTSSDSARSCPGAT